MSTIQKNNTEKKTRLVASSFDYKILDNFLKELTKNMKELNIKYAGPVPLATGTKVFTLLESPHIYKTAMEHFGIKKHRRLLDIYSLGENIKNIQFISNMSITHGIDIRIIAGNKIKKVADKSNINTSLETTNVNLDVKNSVKNTKTASVKSAVKTKEKVVKKKTSNDKKVE